MPRGLAFPALVWHIYTSQRQQHYWHIPTALMRWEIGQWRGRVPSLFPDMHLHGQWHPQGCSSGHGPDAAEGWFECWTEVLWGQLWMQKAEQYETLRDKTSAAAEASQWPLQRCLFHHLSPATISACASRLTEPSCFYFMLGTSELCFDLYP